MSIHSTFTSDVFYTYFIKNNKANSVAIFTGWVVGTEFGLRFPRNQGIRELFWVLVLLGSSRLLENREECYAAAALRSAFVSKFPIRRSLARLQWEFTKLNVPFILHSSWIQQYSSKILILRGESRTTIYKLLTM